MSRSTYYRIPKVRESEEIAMEEAVIHCFKKNDRNYGRIRIKKALEREGICISENKISRIMKNNGLVAKSGRKGRKRTTKTSEAQYVEENLIKDKFEIVMPNKLWCSDFNERVCKDGKFHTCGVIDVGSRRVVGWSFGLHQRKELFQAAFEMAVGRNPERPADAVFHSDRGCQYTAKKSKELVEKHGFRKSMSRPGKPSDNQPIESFWRTLECEMPDIRHLTFEEASRAVARYIELYYNSERLHSGIGYLTPNEYFLKLTL